MNGEVMWQASDSSLSKDLHDFYQGDPWLRPVNVFYVQSKKRNFFADALLRLPALAVNRALRIDRKGAALKVEEQVPRWTRWPEIQGCHQDQPIESSGQWRLASNLACTYSRLSQVTNTKRSLQHFTDWQKSFILSNGTTEAFQANQ